MIEQTENSMLKHSTRFKAAQDRIERELKEIKTRLSGLESGQDSIVQHIGHLSSSIAGQQIATDRMSERPDRVEHQLELT